MGETVAALQREPTDESPRMHAVDGAGKQKADLLELANRIELLGFRLGMAVVWSVIMGEAAALWALADGSTVFLGSLCVLSLGFATLALVLNFSMRVGPSRATASRVSGLVSRTAFLRLIRVLARRPDLFFPGFILVGAWVCSLIAIGDQIHAREAFYSAAAQVYPVLLVAMFLEIASDLGQFRESRRPIEKLEEEDTAGPTGAQRP